MPRVRLLGERFSTAESLAEERLWLAGLRTHTRPVGPARRHCNDWESGSGGPWPRYLLSARLAGPPPSSRSGSQHPRRKLRRYPKRSRLPRVRRSARRTGSCSFRVRYGGKHTKVTAEADGTIVVHTTSGLDRVHARPRRSACRIRASVQRSSTFPSGAVGFYCGHSSFPGKFGEAHQFVGVTYNDILSPRGTRKHPRRRTPSPGG